jgi:hypothetical protein
VSTKPISVRKINLSFYELQNLNYISEKECCFLEYDEYETLKTPYVLQTRDNFKVEDIDPFN